MFYETCSVNIIENQNSFLLKMLFGEARSFSVTTLTTVTNLIGTTGTMKSPCMGDIVYNTAVKRGVNLQQGLGLSQELLHRDTVTENTQ
ncbi:hypothetical protein CHS0354_003562 [Potamilus streckersoni]|uniref:Uncharacterized protein n=1 Tax=Potamilus streckersoni TaxID=2493646 RepID=A0AAE0RVB3_9BIVA|nr:hypothetical protein CHS0354_003562 [Potamilus streckersoni]